MAATGALTATTDFALLNDQRSENNMASSHANAGDVGLQATDIGNTNVSVLDYALTGITPSCSDCLRFDLTDA